jgi:hypothetical protein
MAKLMDSEEKLMEWFEERKNEFPWLDVDERKGCFALNLFKQTNQKNAFTAAKVFFVFFFGLATF